MTDIATLGLKIDSRDTTAATTALDRFAAAAKPAAAGAAAVERATKGVATGTGLARHEMINLSRQIQDVGVSLASGQSPFMVLAQQGTQIADIFGSSKTGSVGGALKQIVNYVGPMRLLALGIAGVAAGGALAVNSLANSAKALDDISRAAGTTLGYMHGIESAASFKGIGRDEFFKAMERLASNVQDARNGMGQLAETFRASGASAKTFEQYLEGIADRIKNASSDAQRLKLLQEAGLPANMQWVRLMQQGADGIKRAAIEAGIFNETVEGKLIAKARAFDDAWNKATTNWGNNLKSWALSAVGWIDDLISRSAQLAMNFNAAQTGVAAPKRIMVTGGTTESAPAAAGPKVKTAAEMQKQISDRQTYLGLLGQTISAEQVAEQIQLQARASYLATGVAVSQSKIDQLKRLAVEQTLGISAIKAATDAQNVETASIGMGVGAATSYAAAQNAINAAKQAGRTLTADNIAAIRAEATALGEAAQRADTMRFGYESLVRGPMQAFRSALSQGATAWDAFRKAGSSALDSIATKLMDMAAQNLWKSAFGGSSGGGLLSLFGLGGGTSAASAVAGGIAPVMHTGYGPGDATASRYVHPAYFDNAPRYHSGIGPGEQAAIIRKDESVLTPGQMKALGNGRGGTPAVTIVQHNTFTNANPESEARMRQALAQTKDMAVKEAVQAVANVKGTSPAYMKASR